jgi:hypothetical protein
MVVQTRTAPPNAQSEHTSTAQPARTSARAKQFLKQQDTPIRKCRVSTRAARLSSHAGARAQATHEAFGWCGPHLINGNKRELPTRVQSRKVIHKPRRCELLWCGVHDPVLPSASSTFDAAVDLRRAEEACRVRVTRRAQQFGDL